MVMDYPLLTFPLFTKIDLNLKTKFVSYLILWVTQIYYFTRNFIFRDRINSRQPLQKMPKLYKFLIFNKFNLKQFCTLVKLTSQMIGHIDFPAL